MKLKVWFVLLLFGLIVILIESVYTLLVVLYPVIAESKNSTALEYTIVFGIYEFSSVIISPFVPAIASLISPKLLFLIALLVEGSSVFGFGFMNQINSHDIFIGVSLVLRIIQGASGCTGMIQIFTLVPSIVPEKFVPFVLGTLETGVCIAFIIGPSLGSLLFSIGGYSLPFTLIGSLLLVVGLTTFIFLIFNVKKEPTETSTCQIQPIKNTEPKPAFTIWKEPIILVQFLVTFLTMLNITFFFGTIESYCRNTLKASPFEVSAIVTAGGSLAGLMSPIMGFFASKEKFKKLFGWVILIGLVVQTVGVLIIGSIIPMIPATYAALFTGIIVLNLGTGLSTFPSYIKANEKIHALGNYETQEESTAISSSGYFMSINFGAMVGPPISGALYDAFGFQNATWLNVGFLVPLILIYGFCMIIESRRNVLQLSYEEL